VDAAAANPVGPASDYEALLEFLYLTPVGIIKFRPDGTIEMANAAAAQLLIPLAADSDMSDIYRLFASVLPDLRQQIERFEPVAGAICDQMQVLVPGTRTVLTLGINKINSGTLMAVIEDISCAIEQERRIRDDQERFRAIFENIRDCAICTVDLDGRIDSWNRSLNRLGGWEPADVVGAPIDIFFPSGKDGLRLGTGLLERARLTGNAQIEAWSVHKDGSTFWGNTVVTALPDQHENVNGFVLVTRDLTDRKQIEDRLVALATTDPLTSASNRRAGEERLAEAFGRWRRYQRSFVVLMIDCDHFKAINDRWGHDGGDAVLVAMVRLCRENMRETDVTIRWGGEEFLLLLPETSRETALVAAERLRQAIEAATVECHGQMINLTVSIGVAEPGETDICADDAVRRADRALYRAKSAGRNRVVHDDPADPRSNQLE
jgi:diguanylate cyclase (GGDEF)-like protein/PAS domain S-box-containing protein